MKNDNRRKSPRKRVLYAKLFGIIVLALLWVYILFIRHPNAEAVTPIQLVISLIFSMVG